MTTLTHMYHTPYTQSPPLTPSAISSSVVWSPPKPKHNMRIPLKTISRKWEYYTQTTFGHTHSLSVSHIYHISQNCNQIWESEWEHTNNTHTFNTPISQFEYWIISRNNTKITVVEKTKAKSKIKQQPWNKKKLKHLANNIKYPFEFKETLKKHTQYSKNRATSIPHTKRNIYFI